MFSDEIAEHVVHPGTPRRNLNTSQLIEAALTRNEGQLASNGAFSAITAPRTGRSPNDKFIVRTNANQDKVDWSNNQPMEPAVFDRLFNRFADYVHERECFVFNGYAGAASDYQLGVRVICEFAWHNLFVRQLFRRPTADELKNHRPEFRVICMPGLRFNPDHDGTNSDAVIAINLERRVVLIGGTRYAGEMKKSVFSSLNYYLPERGVLPMHCSANMGTDGDVALFFGLSGTGKTTLSANPDRQLIGDDEHGWSDQGVFNFEGGCYAKCIGLTDKSEPEIFQAIRYGTVLENVVLEDDRKPDFDDNSITENTRAAYPINFISNSVLEGTGGHPRYVIFLTADATGVLPPVARLSEEQAMYHFLSGYTSKLAGTETGITKPQAAFSACFGGPFLPRPPQVYASLLGEKLKKHGAKTYLVNTGWNGGAYGIGKRISLVHTRAIIDAILAGQLDGAVYKKEPHFGLELPTSIDGIPQRILTPRDTWSDPEKYDEAAANLAERFRKNFEKFTDIDQAISMAQPPVNF